MMKHDWILNRHVLFNEAKLKSGKGAKKKK